MIHLPAALQNMVTNQELPRLHEIPKNTMKILKEVLKNVTFKQFTQQNQISTKRFVL